MYYGKGKPQLIAYGQTITLPTPAGRDPKWEREVDEHWTNVSGDDLFGDTAHRYTCELVYHSGSTARSLSTAQLELLTRLYNNRAVNTCVFRPHQDLPSWQFVVRVMDYEELPPAVDGAQPGARVVFRAVSRVSSIPLPNRSVVGVRLPRVGIV